MTSETEIELFKRWADYTEEERAMLPELPETAIGNSQNPPYMWNGDYWGFIMED